MSSVVLVADCPHGQSGRGGLDALCSGNVGEGRDVDEWFVISPVGLGARCSFLLIGVENVCRTC